MDLEELELAELQYEIYCLEADIDKGLVPAFARRGLYPHEIDARVNFMGIEDETQKNSAEIAAVLIAARKQLFQLLLNDLAQERSTGLLISRVQGVPVYGLGSVGGVQELITETAGQYQTSLERTAIQAAQRLTREAAAQGMDLPSLDRMTEYVLGEANQQVNRLAILPHTDALRAVNEVTARLQSSTSIDDVLSQVKKVGTDLSTGPLERLAQQATTAAVGLGRIDQANQFEEIGAEMEIFASELLDRSTCSPCIQVDGRKYKTIAALRKDYPSSYYKNCLGGSACRGAPVIVFK